MFFEGLIADGPLDITLGLDNFFMFLSFHLARHLKFLDHQFHFYKFPTQGNKFFINVYGVDSGNESIFFDEDAFLSLLNLEQ